MRKECIGVYAGVRLCLSVLEGATKCRLKCRLNPATKCRLNPRPEFLNPEPGLD